MFRLIIDHQQKLLDYQDLEDKNEVIVLYITRIVVLHKTAHVEPKTGNITEYRTVIKLLRLCYTYRLFNSDEPIFNVWKSGFVNF